MDNTTIWGYTSGVEDILVLLYSMCDLADVQLRQGPCRAHFKGRALIYNLAIATYMEKESG